MVAEPGTKRQERFFMSLLLKANPQGGAQGCAGYSSQARQYRPGYAGVRLEMSSGEHGIRVFEWFG